eukprot:2973030-Rhodomonas_salina.3
MPSCCRDKIHDLENCLQDENIESLRGSWDSLLEEFEGPCFEIDVNNHDDEEVNRLEAQNQANFDALKERYITAHNLGVANQQPASKKHLLKFVPTSHKIGEATLDRSLRYREDESALLFGLILIIVLGCGAMHLSLYNSRNFWPACALVTFSGLSLEFVTKRQFENSRRALHRRIHTQPPVKLCSRRRRSSVGGAFTYRTNRSCALLQ